jgi:Arc/MetJ-type ribon-helix-helix transcriptional regulator
MPEGRIMAAEPKPMYVTLTDEIKSFIQEKVATGAFPSEEAVLEEAMRRFWQADRTEGFLQHRRDAASFDDLIDYEAIAS